MLSYRSFYIFIEDIQVNKVLWKFIVQSLFSYSLHIFCLDKSVIQEKQYLFYRTWQQE